MKKRKTEIVYLAVTNDKYSLPVAVFVSISEMARWENCSIRCMKNKIEHHKISIKNKCYFIKVRCKK